MGSAANNLYTSTGGPVAGSFGRSGVQRDEFDLIEAALYKLRAVYLQNAMADANTAGSLFFIVPETWNGAITLLSANNFVTNTTGACGYTVEINGVAVTHATWEHGSTDTAGTLAEVSPTGANEIEGGDRVEIISDGGGSPVMPVGFALQITLA